MQGLAHGLEELQNALDMGHPQGLSADVVFRRALKEQLAVKIVFWVAHVQFLLYYLGSSLRSHGMQAVAVGAAGKLV